MSQLKNTTISSALTELIPALCFNNRFLPKDYTEIEPFFDSLNLTKKNSKKTFIDDVDLNKAQNYQNIKNAIDFKLRDEKFKNCFGIVEYLYTIHDSTPINRCIWSATKKPFNVDKSHPGDIFIQFNNDTICGVSIKAGTESTVEPRLNSRLKSTLLKPIWAEVVPNSMYELKNDLWKKIYINVPNLSNKVDSDNYIQFDYRNIIKPNKYLIENLIDFHHRDAVHFDELYWEMLKVCNGKMVSYVNTYPKTALNWIANEFRIKSSKHENVPVVLVKAIDTKYKIIDDELSKCLPITKTVYASINSNTKQEWNINLESEEYNKTLCMVIRSDSDFRREKPKGKLGAFMNLKLQYKGCR